ncbi:NAD(P)-dependent alcohol dehydrogenase [Rhodococcus sp. ARC_M6]|uniref:NAD(P)-dependent alcohol dehydrogenase n=1 Tax=Rhodococcus sp. ARC_M6 TaxID=2928852 RepID=UPI001FB30964|nr:NAD(P)-dependent alcohol dehydrogenase [Rhodococcus sp. ARC_M6]MCJ0903034.1 NAD(P)-dependent alcohol dehydrogenase [Rhodococcus sp. ARC_M6]
MQMTAALSRGPESPFTLETVQIDDPRPDEILVRIVATGLCHTDLFTKSLLPQTVGACLFGHEGAGIVEAVGSEITHIVPGHHVLLSVRSCGVCRQCIDGHRAYCERSHQLNSAGVRTDGSSPIHQNGAPIRAAYFGQSSFAQYAITTVDNTVVIDPAVNLAVVAPLGCGFQTGAGAVLNMLRPEPDSTFVVFGAGSVGFAAILAARTAGVTTIVAVDPVAERRKLAEEFGAVTIDPATDNIVDAVRAATDGGSAHSLDTTGIGAVINQGVASLRARGTLAVVGLGAREVPLNIADIMLNGKTVRGCIEGDSDVTTFIPRLVELFNAGSFPIDRLVTPYAFSDINQAVADQTSGKVIKPVLLW